MYIYKIKRQYNIIMLSMSNVIYRKELCFLKTFTLEIYSHVKSDSLSEWFNHKRFDLKTVFYSKKLIKHLIFVK